MEQNNSPKIYGYGRHSTGQQGLTKRAQLDTIKRYVEYRFWKDKASWQGMVYDAATSGKSDFWERTQGRALIQTLRPGDHLVIAKLDRAFRSVADGATTLKILTDTKIKVHICDIHVDTSTPNGQFVVNLMLAFAQLEGQYASQRTKDVLSSLRNAGKPYCRSAPMGWRISDAGDEKHYVVDLTEREFIEHLHELREAGYSQYDLAKYCKRQTEMPVKRVFTDRTTVRWALMAREADYPKVVGYKRMRKLQREGKLV